MGLGSNDGMQCLVVATVSLWPSVITEQHNFLPYLHGLEQTMEGEQDGEWRLPPFRTCTSLFNVDPLQERPLPGFFIPSVAIRWLVPTL